jgi:hypothetical protein
MRLYAAHPTVKLHFSHDLSNKVTHEHSQSKTTEMGSYGGLQDVQHSRHTKEDEAARRPGRCEIGARSCGCDCGCGCSRLRLLSHHGPHVGELDQQQVIGTLRCRGSRSALTGGRT